MIYFNCRTSFSFHQAIVIEFNIYVSIFTVCIVFRHSCNTVVIAFNVQLTVVGKEICGNFTCICTNCNCSCISIGTNTNANVFQLCYVNSVGILVTSSYVDNLAFLIFVTNGNSTNLCTRIPLITICINRSFICTITNNSTI